MALVICFFFCFYSVSAVLLTYLSCCITDLLFTFMAVVSDQDSVRLLAVECCAAIGKLLEPQDCVAHMLPVIVNFSQVCIRTVLFLYIC